MNNLIDHEEESEAPHRRDREITLGTTTVLGIFFGLAILCATFFGFGYSLGSKHSTPGVTANGDPLAERSGSAFKPTPGSPIGSAARSYTADPTPQPVASVSPTPAKPSYPPAPAPATASGGNMTTDKPIRPQPPSIPVPPPSSAAATTPLQLVVQVTALSHREDAEMIASTLERRGYAVFIRTDPQDKLFHVQLGPFATRTDAEAMRQKVLADGFNAYIK